MSEDLRPGPDPEWRPSVPALVQMVAATAGPRLREAFAAAGLDDIRPAQSVVLVPLAGGASHASALAEHLRVSRQAVAQAVAALERTGYVRRSPDARDGRTRLVELTQRGWEALAVMRSGALATERQWQRALGRRRLDELRDTLLALLESSGAGE